jgi:hypothetical protein
MPDVCAVAIDHADVDRRWQGRVASTRRNPEQKVGLRAKVRWSTGARSD